MKNLDITSEIFPLQVVAGRSLLGWTQNELSMKSGVSRITINRLERGIRINKITVMMSIRSALVDAGIVSIDDGDAITVTINGENAKKAMDHWKSVRDERKADRTKRIAA